MSHLLQRIGDIRDLKARGAVLVVFYFSLIFLVSHFAAELAIAVAPYPPRSLSSAEWQTFLYALWYCPFLIPFFLLPRKEAQKPSTKLEVYYLAIAILTASFSYAFVTRYEPAMVKWARRENNPVQDWLQRREAASLADPENENEGRSEVRALERDPEAAIKLIHAMQYGPDALMLSKARDDALKEYDIFLQLQDGERDQNSAPLEPVEPRDEFVAQNLETFTLVYRSRAIEGLAALSSVDAINALKDFSLKGQPEQLRSFAASKLTKAKVAPNRYQD